MYIGVLHLINATHTHTHRFVEVPGDAGGMSGLSDAAVGGRGEWEDKARPDQSKGLPRIKPDQVCIRVSII